VRNWGVVVTLAYMALIICLCPPALVLLTEATRIRLWTNVGQAYGLWGVWVALLPLLAGPLVLLLVPVDTAFRPRRRRHIAYTAIATGLAFAMLAGMAVFNALLAIPRGVDAALDADPLRGPGLLGLWAIVWLAWAIILWRLGERLFNPAHRLHRWLIAGSALELLIAVPTHVIVRRQDRCTEPLISAYGVVTGLAILLLSLGPAVLFLYRARWRRHYPPAPRPSA
jgi:hypothetical protein